MKLLSLLVLAAALVLACSDDAPNATPTPVTSIETPLVTATSTPAPAPSPTPPQPTPEPTPINVDTIPIVDFHFHADAAWSLDTLLALFNELGVATGVGGSLGPDAVGLSFAQQHPDRFIPFAGMNEIHALNRAEGSQSWQLQSPRILAYLDRLEQGLRFGCWEGIGEVFPNTQSSHRMPIRFPADAPLIQRLWSLSATYDVPLMVHMDADPVSVAEMESVIASDRNGTWIWAHTGWYSTPSLLRRLLNAHPNLYAELSFRDDLRSFAPISDAGRLRPEWRELLEEMPERFFLGTDILVSTPTAYRDLIRYWRGILSQLTPETALKVAKTNAEQFLQLGSASARSFTSQQCDAFAQSR